MKAGIKCQETIKFKEFDNDYLKGIGIVFVVFIVAILLLSIVLSYVL